MKKVTILYFIIFLIAFSCQNQENASATFMEKEPRPNTLTSQQMEMANIQWGKLEQRAMQEVLNTSGMVDLPPQNTYLVHGLHEGYVGKVPQTVGDYVKKGQVLTRLKHPNLIRLQRRLLEKRIELKQLEQDYERKKTLIQEEATSKLSLEKVEVQYQLAKAQFKGIQSELKAIGISPERLLETEQFQQSVAIVAPANGFVKTIAIHPGQLVQPNEELYEILDLSHKHIEIEVLAKDIQRVKVGQKVKVRIGSC